MNGGGTSWRISRYQRVKTSPAASGGLTQTNHQGPSQFEALDSFDDSTSLLTGRRTRPMRSISLHRQPTKRRRLWGTSSEFPNPDLRNRVVVDVDLPQG